MKFSELPKPILDEVEGFPGIFVGQGSFDALNELIRIENDITSNDDEEAKTKHQMRQTRFLFKNYIVAENGEPFEDMVGPNANFGAVSPVLVKAVSDVIIQRLSGEKKGNTGTN